MLKIASRRTNSNTTILAPGLKHHCYYVAVKFLFQLQHAEDALSKQVVAEYGHRKVEKCRIWNPQIRLSFPKQVASETHAHMWFTALVT